VDVESTKRQRLCMERNRFTVTHTSVLLSNSKIIRKEIIVRPTPLASHVLLSHGAPDDRPRDHPAQPW
jgi:hypothetical protein